MQPTNWNSLPAHLRDNSLSLSSFKRHLKTSSYYYRLAHAARLGSFYKNALYKSTVVITVINSKLRASIFTKLDLFLIPMVTGKCE